MKGPPTGTSSVQKSNWQKQEIVYNPLPIGNPTSSVGGTCVVGKSYTYDPKIAPPVNAHLVITGLLLIPMPSTP
jgi:hypothetical protein